MPQFSYSFPPAQLGQIGTFGPPSIDCLVNPLLPQISTVTVVDNDAGAYAVSIVGPEGSFSFGITVVAQTIAQVADQLAAAAVADDDLLNIVEVTSDGVDTVTMTFLHSGVDYTVGVTSASADLTLALTQASGGSEYPLGIGIVDAGNKVGRQPTTGDVALDILGISCNRSDCVLPFSMPGFASSASIAVGGEVAVLRQGEIWVRPETAVAVNDPVYCRVVATGAEVAGALRNTADGGDAVLLPGRFRTAASAGGLAKIQLNAP